MSKTNDFYLLKNTKALERQQLIQDKLNAQDTWWSPEDKDKDYQNECEQKLKEEDNEYF